MSGQNEQADRRKEFSFAEPVPFFFDLDELADEVFLGMAPFFRHQQPYIVEVRADFFPLLNRGLFVQCTNYNLPNLINKCPGPLAGQIPVIVWNSQHVGNDIDRQGKA